MHLGATWARAGANQSNNGLFAHLVLLLEKVIYVCKLSVQFSSDNMKLLMKERLTYLKTTYL